MAVQPREPAQRLAHRLRELREREWPEVSITQRQLGEALSGGRRGTSPPSISSWERGDNLPPPERLAAYAGFFATRRSVAERPYRLLREDELTGDERVRRDALLAELRSLRDTATARRHDTPQPLGGPWHFSDDKPVTIVCAELPEAQRAQFATGPEDPERAYAELHRYADLDALFALHGQIRAANPTSDVHIRTAARAEDLTTHLVVLGGVDWNFVTRNILNFLPEPLPAQQVTTGARGPADAVFVVSAGEERQEYRVELDRDGALLADVGHFYRAPNPLNRRRSLTLCNGLTSRGVLGAVQALVDERFRDRNTEFLEQRFPGADAFSILMKVQIVGGAVVTPDWTVPAVTLHTWPEAS